MQSSNNISYFHFSNRYNNDTNYDTIKSSLNELNKIKDALNVIFEQNNDYIIDSFSIIKIILKNSEYLISNYNNKPEEKCYQSISTKSDFNNNNFHDNYYNDSNYEENEFIKLSQISSSIHQLQKIISILNENNNALNNNLLELIYTTYSLFSEKQLLEKENRYLLSQNSIKNEEMNELYNQFNDVVTKNNDLLSQYNEYNDAIDKLKSENNEIMERDSKIFNNKEKEIDSLNKEVESLQCKNKELNDIIRKLETDKTCKHYNKNNSNVISNIKISKACSSELLCNQSRNCFNSTSIDNNDVKTKACLYKSRSRSYSNSNSNLSIVSSQKKNNQSNKYHNQFNVCFKKINKESYAYIYQKNRILSIVNNSNYEIISKSSNYHTNSTANCSRHLYSNDIYSNSHNIKESKVDLDSNSLEYDDIFEEEYQCLANLELSSVKESKQIKENKDISKNCEVNSMNDVNISDFKDTKDAMNTKNINVNITKKYVIKSNLNTIGNKNKSDPYKDFFMLTYSSYKLNSNSNTTANFNYGNSNKSQEEENNHNLLSLIEPDRLFSIAENQNIPFHHFHKFIKNFFEFIRNKNHKGNVVTTITYSNTDKNISNKKASNEISASNKTNIKQEDVYYEEYRNHVFQNDKKPNITDSNVIEINNTDYYSKFKRLTTSLNNKANSLISCILNK